MQSLWKVTWELLIETDNTNPLGPTLPFISVYSPKRLPTCPGKPGQVFPSEGKIEYTGTFRKFNTVWKEGTGAGV